MADTLHCPPSSVISISVNPPSLPPSLSPTLPFTHPHFHPSIPAYLRQGRGGDRSGVEGGPQRFGRRAQLLFDHSPYIRVGGDGGTVQQDLESVSDLPREEVVQIGEVLADFDV